MQEEPAKETEPNAFGYIKENSIYLIKGDFLYYYENGFYGQPEGQALVLALEEAALLIERNRIIIYRTTDLKEIFPIDELIEYFSSIDIYFWGRYLVYKDLRSRGYVVRPGFGNLTPYRRYPRGTKPNSAQSDTFIFPFLEGTFLQLHELDLIVNQAQSNRKALILGCVDRSGDVTYYRTSEFQIPFNHERYEWPDEKKEITN